MKKKMAAFGICTALFLLLIVLVRTVDVASVGPEGTSIGLSKLNASVHSALGVNMIFYELTQVIGTISLLVAAFFAGFTVFQFLKRRSLPKTDKELLALLGLYALLFAAYVFFEIVIINYRPIIMPGADSPEASFPSSHTMLTCTIMGSTFMLLPRYVKQKNIARLLQIFCVLMIVVMVLGRLISGVHWFTDITAGVLFGAALLSLYSAALQKIGGSREEK